MWKDFLDLLFPNYCQMCEESLERGERLICWHCHYHLPLANYHKLADSPLARRFAGKVAVQYAWAYLKFTKEGKVQHLLHQLKYHNKPEIGNLMGQWYAKELQEYNLDKAFDLILPVPLHQSRLRKRGYNQSDTFAQGLSQGLQVEWHPSVLRRNVASSTQTKKKRFDRWKNVEKIFEVALPEKVAGKRILLVDDVITTGSTVEACVKILLEANCKEVSIAAIAAAQ